MSRVFWVTVGAVGGIVAYRRGTRAAERARELGPLGSAQVAAQATSRLAGRAAHGLGRLSDLKAQRDGRLVLGSAEAVGTEQPIPPGWVPAESATRSDDHEVPLATAGSPGDVPTPGLPTTAGAAPRTTRPRRGARAGSSRDEA